MKKTGRQILVFKLAEEELGLDVFSVREVLRIPEIHPLPQGPDFIEGVINLRKHIIAVMDMRKKLNFDPTGHNEDKRIIVCGIDVSGGGSVKPQGPSGKIVMGMIVDSVSEVITVPEKNIEPAVQVLSTQVEAGCISGIARSEERVITILDVGKMFTKEETQRLFKTKKKP